MKKCAECAAAMDAGIVMVPVIRYVDPPFDGGLAGLPVDHYHRQGPRQHHTPVLTDIFFARYSARMKEIEARVTALLNDPAHVCAPARRYGSNGEYFVCRDCGKQIKRA